MTIRGPKVDNVETSRWSRKKHHLEELAFVVPTHVKNDR
jgi:hypothetical protein